MLREPRKPDHTCPHIDSAIAEMETVRRMNEELRTWGEYWQEQYTEKEDEMKDMQKEHNQQISNLEDQIEQLNYELKARKQTTR
jgi:predicted RNase H-like nuclease (RuvC/YqgF family)